MACGAGEVAALRFDAGGGPLACCGGFLGRDEEGVGVGEVDVGGVLGVGFCFVVAPLWGPVGVGGAKVEEPVVRRREGAGGALELVEEGCCIAGFGEGAGG